MRKGTWTLWTVNFSLKYFTGSKPFDEFLKLTYLLMSRPHRLCIKTYLNQEEIWRNNWIAKWERHQLSTIIFRFKLLLYGFSNNILSWISRTIGKIRVAERKSINKKVRKLCKTKEIIKLMNLSRLKPWLFKLHYIWLVDQIRLSHMCKAFCGKRQC